MTTGLMSVPLGPGHRLNTAALPLLLIGILAALLSLYALATRRYLLARATAILTAGAMVWGGWLIAHPTPEMTQ